ncbi:MAG: 23S rRNA (pseudouridine(1915)-N(3))-methyltransferase RlmH [Gemmatimonadota bacterium]|nr:23S rRNA (pseudouridine(1915)-N(3))-methyltransferase RlmH [Gemmatimonadota bacterium]
MKLSLIVVGRARGALTDPIAEYERRVRRYFSWQSVEVREESFRGSGDEARVRREEGERLMGQVPRSAEMIALDQGGERWSSEELADYLVALPLRSVAGAAFLIGGAYGLSDVCLQRSARLLSLSPFTLPHELARLVITEQLYRAGTIGRGEPYHKGPRG